MAVSRFQFSCRAQETDFGHRLSARRFRLERVESADATIRLQDDNSRNLKMHNRLIRATPNQLVVFGVCADPDPQKIRALFHRQFCCICS